MKTKTILLIVFGVLGLCCLGGLGIGLFAFKAGAAAQKDAEEYAKKVVPEIASTWDADKMWAASNDTFKSISTKDDVKKFFKRWSEKLGGLKTIKDMHMSGIHSKYEGQSTLSVVEDLSVQFEKSEGTIHLTLVKTNDWAVQEFKVDAPALSQ